MWKIHYYTDSKGKCEIEEFINSFNYKEQARIDSAIFQLKTEGPNLRRPRADILEDKIYELRVQLSGKKYRILYFFVFRDHIIMTHGFQKQTKSIPKKEINKAKKIKEKIEGEFPNLTTLEEHLDEKF